MNVEDSTQLLLRLASLPYETEWVELKRDNADPGEIGEYQHQPQEEILHQGRELLHRLQDHRRNPRQRADQASRSREPVQKARSLRAVLGLILM